MGWANHLPEIEKEVVEVARGEIAIANEGKEK